MSDYKVIAGAGESLIRALWTAIAADSSLSGLISSEDLISLESPAEHIKNNDDALLSVYLYQIREDPYLKNQGPVEGPGGMLEPPPMALNLYYLITPMLKTTQNCQIVLGKVMQTLYDRPALEGPDLAGSLAGSDAVLRTVFDTVSTNEIALIWQALDVPYMLCAPYVVRVALMNSTRRLSQARVVQVDRRLGARSPDPAGGAR